MTGTLVSSPSILDQFGDAVRAAFAQLSPVHQTGLSNPRFVDRLSRIRSDDARVAAIQEAAREREALSLRKRTYNIGTDLIVV